jgi:hypothetical protein
MGNTVYLSSYKPSHDKSGTAQDPYALTWGERGLAKPELEINYTLPICWLALFEAEDLRPREQLCLIAGAEQARSRLASRHAALARLIGPELGYLLYAFERIAMRFEPFVICRLDQLAMMDSEGVFEAELRAALELIEDPDQIVAGNPAFAGFTSLPEDWRKRKAPEGILVGYGHQWPPKKPAVDPDEMQWYERVTKVPNESAVAYTPRGAFRSDELVRHAVHGVGVVARELDGNKIDVLFQTGRKVLVHRRSA